MKSNPTWQTVRVAATTDLTPTVREFVLQPVEGAAIAWAPGAHLQLRLNVAGREQHRSYSLVGLPAEVPGAYRIAVKRLDDGRGGLRIPDILPVRSDIRVSDDKRMLIRMTDETVLKGIDTLPLFAGFAGLAVLLLAMSAMWWREGR